MVLAPALALVQCTDLEETPTSVITPDNFFTTDAEVLGSLASVYAILRNSQWAYYNLSQISSDEQIVPLSNTWPSVTARAALRTSTLRST